MYQCRCQVGLWAALCDDGIVFLLEQYLVAILDIGHCTIMKITEHDITPPAAKDTDMIGIDFT